MTTEERERFGGYLRSLRRALHLTLQSAADAAEISNPYLSQIEMGRRNPPPSSDILCRLARVYETPETNLLREAGHIRTEENNTEKESGAIMTEPGYKTYTLPICFGRVAYINLPCDTEIADFGLIKEMLGLIEISYSSIRSFSTVDDNEEARAELIAKLQERREAREAEKIAPEAEGGTAPL